MSYIIMVEIDEEGSIDQKIFEVYHQIFKIDKTNPILQMIRVQGDKVVLSDNIHRAYEGSIGDKYKHLLRDLEAELGKYKPTNGQK